EKEEQLGLEQSQLLGEERPTGRHFVGRGRAVARRTALEYVRDEDVATGEPDRGEHALEELPRVADEGPTARVLVGSGRLAYHDEPRAAAPLAEHHRRARLAEPAPPTRERGGAKTVERVRAALPIPLRDGRGGGIGRGRERCRCRAGAPGGRGPRRTPSDGHVVPVRGSPRRAALRIGAPVAREIEPPGRAPN